MQGILVFITGLSGSGKTTLAKNIQNKMLTQKNIKSILLDGDELRSCINNSRYTKDSRLKIAKYYINIANILYKQGFIVLLSTISMFEEIRKSNRDNFKNYIEVFLDVSLEIRKRRDSKNFFKNKIKNMAGVDQILEFPKNSDFIFKDNFDIEQAQNSIIKHIYSIKDTNE